MNKLSREKQAQTVAALVEGNSIRATARMLDLDKETVMKLQKRAGYACAEYQDKAMHGLTCKRVQCDEIWAFCYAKDKNLPADKQRQFGFGSIWTWVAIDADTKLIPSFVVGNRDAATARMLIEDLAGRVRTRIQLTTDGLRCYLEAVEGAFGADIDYAMLVKTYESSQEETRYSPPICTSCEEVAHHWMTDPKHISTSYVERQNLSMRMGIRRFTRLTNAFSKKVENHAAAVSLYFMHYIMQKLMTRRRMTWYIAILAAAVWSGLLTICVFSVKSLNALLCSFAGAPGIFALHLADPIRGYRYHPPDVLDYSLFFAGNWIAFFVVCSVVLVIWRAAARKS